MSSDQDLSWRQWDGDYVVFNPASGDTHVLDIATGEVLMRLAAGPATIAEITERLAAFLEIDKDGGLAEAATDMVQKLDELGLVEPAPPC